MGEENNNTVTIKFVYTQGGFDTEQTKEAFLLGVIRACVCSVGKATRYRDRDRLRRQRERRRNRWHCLSRFEMKKTRKRPKSPGYRP